MEVNGDLPALLDEQRREIAAAQAAEDDLLFAFQLQMEEAMINSLPKNAASSSRLIFYDEDVIPNNTVSHLFAEELLKYEQQVHDCKKAESEMKKIEDDLNRRIHDQAFAREIQRVPEDQWKKTGDHLQRPYGEGSSKGGVAMQNGECFRVYVKGLMGEDVEETDGVGEKQVAGIGVAVCDPSGILVFEVSKGLIASAEVVLTDEIVELKALIEGLDVATMLGLKRVNFFLDSQTIFQYVRGKVHPRKENIAALVEQATAGLRKFADSITFVVAPNTVNFAIKLATDAIVSQVKQPSDSTRKRKSITESCAICLQDTDMDHMFLINGCLHYYCFSCMNKHVEVKLLQGMLPKCPHDGCKSELKIDDCKKFLTPKMYDLMSERVKETTIPIAEKIYCPNPQCSTLMSKAEVQISSQTGARTCMKCCHIFCINCKVPWHENMTCFDYRRLNPYKCVDDAKLKSLATQCRWRQCAKCNHMVSLAEGCFHINCRCGHEFCYTCGAEWKNKKATCCCPIWAERNIIHQARRG
uniref:RBR-type E3 ubiquitin transferase n=1 Tax=Solanum chacoense TaxID=4108 RepID=A0A0V0IFY7_SOLCH